MKNSKDTRTKGSRRLPEIDALRGVAVALMVVSNLLFDLSFFYGTSFLPYWLTKYLARFTAGLFIFVSGMALTQKYLREKGRPHLFRVYLIRSAKLLAFGMVITFATWLAVGEQLVVFGVLHFLAVAAIVVFPLLRYTYINIIAGACALFLGFTLNSLPVETWWFLWLGLIPDNFNSVDYIPLFPWLGPMLFGIGCSHLLFPEAGRLRKFVAAGEPFSPMGLLQLTGKKSLLIYLVHQPVLLGVLYILNQ